VAVCLVAIVLRVPHKSRDLRAGDALLGKQKPQTPEGRLVLVAGELRTTYGTYYIPKITYVMWWRELVGLHYVCTNHTTGLSSM
jgi:hypothetical protein